MNKPSCRSACAFRALLVWSQSPKQFGHDEPRPLGGAAGREPIFALWLTHSEVLSAPEQCAQMRAAQVKLPWVREGDDVSPARSQTDPRVQTV